MYIYTCMYTYTYIYIFNGKKKLLKTQYMFIMTQNNDYNGNIHLHLGFNNLPRPNHQNNYSSFGGLSEKLENYKSLKNDI